MSYIKKKCDVVVVVGLVLFRIRLSSLSVDHSQFNPYYKGINKSNVLKKGDILV